MNPVIRIANFDDEAAIVECVNAAYSKYVNRIGRKPAPMLDDYHIQIEKKQAHVFEKQDKITGIVILIPKPDYLYLENIAVHPSYQGKGIGRQLMQYAESIARSFGFSEIQLFTNEAMHENIAMYINYGYLETVRKIENGYRRIHFSKMLPRKQ